MLTSDERWFSMSMVRVADHERPARPAGVLAVIAIVIASLVSCGTDGRAVESATSIETPTPQEAVPAGVVPVDATPVQAQAITGEPAQAASQESAAPESAQVEEGTVVEAPVPPEPQQESPPGAADQTTPEPEPEPEPESEQPPAEPIDAQADPVSSPDKFSLPYVPADLRADDLGSGSPEFSGVTVNNELNRLVIVDDEDRLFEFELDGAGNVLGPPLRTMRIQTGGGDTEGVSWMYGEVYALMGENFGLITVVDLKDANQQVTTDMVVHTLETGISEDGGSGAEGVAFDRSALAGADPATSKPAWVFWSVKEKPATLVRLSSDGSGRQSGRLPSTMTDVADVFASPDGRLFVVSDERRAVYEVDVNADLSSIEILATHSLAIGEGRFEQPEGLTFSDDLFRMYVVSEGPQPGRFSYGLFIPVQ